MITSSTKVTFPEGKVIGESIILSIKDLPEDDSKSLIITEETPFHPLDYYWQDQPSDRGKVIISDYNINIDLCLTAAINKTTDVFLVNKAIKAKRDDSEWFFLVAHIVNKKDLEPFGHFESLIGKSIKLQVNETYRQKLSETHTACHLAALALNKATSSFWQKKVRQDSLNNFDLDSMAIVESKIYEGKSLDIYRFGKSIRKKGLKVPELLSKIDEVAKEINVTLFNWLKVTLQFQITPLDSLLSDIRIWQCQLSDGLAKIPCGGTHVSKFFANSVKIKVVLEVIEGSQNMQMLTNIEHF